MSTSEKQVGGRANVNATGTVRYESSARWVRVEFNGRIVGDSRETLLVWHHRPRPIYYFPLADIAEEYLVPVREDQDGRQYYDVTVDGRIAGAAAWAYLNPACEYEPLRGYATFKWDKMDHWYEEEEEILAHPRDPYHRVDAICSKRHVQVSINGVTLAESDRPTLLFETGLPTRYYIPREDVRMEYLEPSRAKTACPYKGIASYWTAHIGDQEFRNVVWGYMDPLPESVKIKGLLCFFNEKVDVYVDGELEEQPQTPWNR